jgi:uncharacterized protein YdiU (UPF0061 family)
VLVRLSHSHVRIGTFQRLAYLDETAKIADLVAYSCSNFYPELSPEPDLPSAFLREVTRRSAELCASWLVAGFVHGVLNSDNMVVTGESFDYGPYRFLPHYDPGFVAAYFDSSGLYAFGRQPRAVLRNLARLGESLTLVGDAARLSTALGGFPHELSVARAGLLHRRLGLEPLGYDDDQRFSSLCWDFLAASGMPYDQFFFDWFGGQLSAARAAASPAAPHYASSAFESLRSELERRTPTAPEALHKAYFQRSTPCTLIIDEVERVWSAIAERDDWAPFQQKIADIRELGAALS